MEASTISPAVGRRVPRSVTRYRTKRVRSASSSIGIARTKKARKLLEAKKMGFPKITPLPFPKTHRVVLSWEPPAVQLNSGASNGKVSQIKLNDCYDPDYTSDFGNGQPFYFDQLCSSTGPYKSFIVHGWRTKIEVVNLTDATHACEFIYSLTATQGDGDTITELLSSADTQRVMLAGIGLPKSTYVFYETGKTSDYTTKPVFDSSCVGSASSSPSTLIYGNIGATVCDGTVSVLKYGVKVTHLFDVEFFDQDGVSS